MQGARVLQISQTFGDLNILVLERPDPFCETNFDRYLFHYQRVVTLARQVLESTGSYPRDIGKLLCFCLDIHIVERLYAVTHKCRDHLIRRGALRLRNHTRGRMVHGVASWPVGSVTN